MVAAFAIPVLAGCAGQSGAGSSQGQAPDDTTVSDLRNKVVVIEHDPCAHGGAGGYQICADRFIMQIENVAQAAIGQAGSTKHPAAVRDAGKALADASSAFQDPTCVDSSGVAACAGKLHRVDIALHELGKALGVPAHATS